MNDILPDQTPARQYLEDRFRETARAFGYREIRFPLLEQTRLFKRSIGEATDIVEKEMYTFADAGGELVSLRPEGTAGCVRAAQQHGLLYNRQQRLWYQGPMFRRERPQKGRYRQFHQFGVEAFGMAGPDIDAEVIELSAAFWSRLDLAGCLTLQLNNSGSAADRQRYGEVLGQYLASRADELDASARSRIGVNPFRVLDSKHPGNQQVLREAPAMSGYLGAAEVAHYEGLKELLAGAGIDFVENPSLVRGLDYYNGCVFEWTTTELGAQGAVCGGGRYDGLVAQLGGRPTPAAGFAIGIERLALLLESQQKLPDAARAHPDVCVIVDPGATSAATPAEAQALARRLRALHPGRSIVCQCGGGKLAQQIKRAWEMRARLAVIVMPGLAGAPPQVKLRALDNSFPPRLLPVEQCVAEIGALLATDHAWRQLGAAQ